MSMKTMAALVSITVWNWMYEGTSDNAAVGDRYKVSQIER